MQTVRGRDRGDHRGAAPGRARAPLPGRRARRRRAAPPADVRRGRRRAAPEPGRRPPRRPRRPARANRARRPRLRKPWRTEVVERLADEQMLPGDRVRVLPRGLRPGRRAVPGRRGCGSPTSADRRRAARASPTRTPRTSPTTTSTCSATTRGSPGLEAGVAAHHAGMVPPMKEAVEEAFAAGLAQGRVRDRDAVARHQHAGALGGDREAVEVHRRASRVPDPGRVHPARRACRPARHRRRRLRGRALGPVRAASTRSPALASRRTYALHVVVPADLQHGRQPRAAVSTRGSPPPARPVVRAVSTPTATSWRSTGSSNRPASSSRGRATPPGSRTATSRSTGRCSRRVDEARRAAHAGAGQPPRRAATRRRRHGAAARRPGRRPQAGARPARATACSRSPSSARRCG